MLSTWLKSGNFCAVYDEIFCNSDALLSVVREHLSQAGAEADVFEYGGKTLIIAYPSAPKCVEGAALPRLMRISKSH